MFTCKEIMILSVSLLAVAVTGGILLWLRTGMPLLYIGLAGAACSLLYPFLKYHSLGDFVIFAAIRGICFPPHFGHRICSILDP